MDESYPSSPPEKISEQLTHEEQAKYNELLEVAIEHLPPDAHFAYVPSEEWSEFGNDDSRIEKLSFEQLIDRLSQSTGPVGIGVHGRDTVSTKAPQNDPRRNVELTETSTSNVEKGINLWNALTDKGRDGVTFITSGRSHVANIGVFHRLQEALKVPDNEGGLNGNPAGYTLEADAEINGLTTEEFTEKLGEIITELDEQGKTRFARVILGYKASADDIEAAKQACIQDFINYPQITEAELMTELAVEGGVPKENQYLEDRSWDTITQFVWLRKWVEQNNAKDLLIVIGEDQLPRAAVLSARIFKGVDVNLSLVGCNPRLEAGEFPDTFTRERKSLITGANWLDEVMQDSSDNWSILRRLYRHPAYNNPPSKNAGYRTYQMTQHHHDKEDYGVR